MIAATLKMRSTIEKDYIDGPRSSKTLAGVLLACFERVSHVTHFYEQDQKEQCLFSMVGLWNFPAQMFGLRLGPGISRLQEMLG